MKKQSIRTIHIINGIWLALLLFLFTYLAVWGWGKIAPVVMIANSFQALLAIGMCVVCWVFSVRRRHRENELGRASSCAKCGYNLTGNQTGICPECGHRMGRRKALASASFTKWYIRTIHIVYGVCLTLLLLVGVLLTTWCWGKVSLSMLPPYIAMAIMAVGGCIMAWVEHVRRWRRENELDETPWCAKCGYNLPDNIVDACPECGTAIARQDSPSAF